MKRIILLFLTGLFLLTTACAKKIGVGNLVSSNEPAHIYSESASGDREGYEMKLRKDGSYYIGFVDGIIDIFSYGKWEYASDSQLCLTPVVDKLFEEKDGKIYLDYTFDNATGKLVLGDNLYTLYSRDDGDYVSELEKAGILYSWDSEHFAINIMEYAYEGADKKGAITAYIYTDMYSNGDRLEYDGVITEFTDEYFTFKPGKYYLTMIPDVEVPEEWKVFYKIIEDEKEAQFTIGDNVFTASYGGNADSF